MGASAFSIVRQFLYESVIVMLADILLSVVAVMDGLLVYKVIYEATPDRWGDYHDWIIYISPYSIAMFVVCSVAHDRRLQPDLCLQVHPGGNRGIPESGIGGCRICVL